MSTKRTQAQFIASRKGSETSLWKLIIKYRKIVISLWLLSTAKVQRKISPLRSSVMYGYGKMVEKWGRWRGGWALHSRQLCWENKLSQAGRRPGGSHGTGPALPRPAALTNTPHCGLVTLMKVGGNGCPGGPTAVPGPARWPCPLPGIALFLSA